MKKLKPAWRERLLQQDVSYIFRLRNFVPSWVKKEMADFLRPSYEAAWKKKVLFCLPLILLLGC